MIADWFIFNNYLVSFCSAAPEIWRHVRIVQQGCLSFRVITFLLHLAAWGELELYATATVQFIQLPEITSSLSSSVCLFLLFSLQSQAELKETFSTNERSESEPHSLHRLKQWRGRIKRPAESSAMLLPLLLRPDTFGQLNLWRVGCLTRHRKKNCPLQMWTRLKRG